LLPFLVSVNLLEVVRGVREREFSLGFVNDVN
jgi:hypothetical protein